MYSLKVQISFTLKTVAALEETEVLPLWVYVSKPGAGMGVLCLKSRQRNFTQRNNVLTWFSKLLDTLNTKKQQIFRCQCYLCQSFFLLIKHPGFSLRFNAYMLVPPYGVLILTHYIGISQCRTLGRYCLIWYSHQI